MGNNYWVMVIGVIVIGVIVIDYWLLGNGYW